MLDKALLVVDIQWLMYPNLAKGIYEPQIKLKVPI